MVYELGLESVLKIGLSVISGREGPSTSNHLVYLVFLLSFILQYMASFIHGVEAKLRELWDWLNEMEFIF